MYLLNTQRSVRFRCTADEDKYHVRISPHPSSGSDSMTKAAGGDITIQSKKADFARKFLMAWVQLS